MYAHPTSPQPLRLPHFFTHWIVGFVAALLLVLTSFVAHAAPPPAGTSISNQASATYTDGANIARTVTSNVVQTTVSQVASLTLTTPGAQNANPGSVAYYPHTLTNTGNGSDTFGFTTANAANTGVGGGFTMSTVQIFADNGSGLPTGLALTTSGLLASGAAFKFIVVDTLPSTAASGQINTVTVTATSSFPGAANASNADVTTVTANAVVTLTKAVSASSGAANSGPYTYTLTYTNTGNSTATAVAISDVIPAGMTYVLASAKWSGLTAALSDTTTPTLAGTAPNTLTSSLNGSTFLATLNQVAAGQSGTISFQVKVAGGTAPGNLNNTATTSYNNGVATVTGSSNTVPFNVLQTVLVSFAGPAATLTAAAGSTVSFDNLVTNGGNGTDTFNITLSTGSFPLGTTFQLFKSDGVTPLVDTNGDGIVDTGPLAASLSYKVVLKATLPPNAPKTTTPSSVTKTATSVIDPTQKAIATDTLNAITGATVDLSNNTATGPGTGTGVLTLAVTNLVFPGNTTPFTLVVNNTGATPDSYDLASNIAANFGSAALPDGWTVTFKAGSCTTTGATIANTGTVLPGAANAVNVCALVTVPAGYAAGTTDLYFRVLSSTSGTADILHDAVTVNAVRSITITPPGVGQTYPGGSVVYTHTLTNTGNVTEGNGTVSSIALTAANPQAGWTSLLYYDANNNGVLDALDPQITASLNAVLVAGLAPGASITVFDKVTAFSGAVPGAVDVTTITVTTTNGTTAFGYVSTVPALAVITDSTTVVPGNVSLTKNQSLDAACAGPLTATVYSGASLFAKPDQCVLYQIIATNLGSANATVVVVSDATPAFTAINSLAATTVGTVTGPAVGATGTISAAIGTLTPGQTATVTFGVRIAK
jgi:trimeric autotransporter adhesin